MRRHRGQMALVAVLAAAAVLFGDGCYFLEDFLEDFVPARRVTEAATGIMVLCLDDTAPGGDGDGYLQAFEWTDEGRLREVNGPFNGEDCEYSDVDTARLHAIIAERGPVLPPVNDAVEPRRDVLENVFGRLSPIPGAPFFTKNSGLPQTCSMTSTFYMVNHVRDTVSHYALCPLQVIRRIGVRSRPLQAELTPDGSTLVVTSYDSGITLIDTATDTVTATINTPNRYPNGIAISRDGQLAYVTNYNDVSSGVFVVDLGTRQIVANIPTSAFPKSVLLTPDGSQLWVLYYQGGSIDIIDTLTLTLNGSVPVNGQADTGMAFNPTGTRAYIAVRRGQLAVIDTATLQYVTTLLVDANPTDVVFTPDGDNIFVRGTSGELWRIDARHDRVVGHLPVGGLAGMGLAIFE